jgi:hypothetical protein
MTEKRHCSQCSGNFELVPPADPEYRVPKMKPTTEDHIMMVYDCDNIGCQNRIYWEKSAVIVSKPYATEALRNRQTGVKGEGVSRLESLRGGPRFD